MALSKSFLFLECLSWYLTPVNKDAPSRPSINATISTKAQQVVTQHPQDSVAFTTTYLATVPLHALLWQGDRPLLILLRMSGMAALTHGVALGSPAWQCNSHLPCRTHGREERWWQDMGVALTVSVLKGHCSAICICRPMQVTQPTQLLLSLTCTILPKEEPQCQKIFCIPLISIQPSRSKTYKQIHVHTFFIAALLTNVAKSCGNNPSVLQWMSG